MTRQKIWSICLLIASAAALMIAWMPNSVTVFNPSMDAAVSYSFFQQIPGVSVGVLLLLSGICTGLSVMVAVADLIVHKEGLRTGLMMLSMAAAALAVLPLVFDRSTVVLPNMIHPLLMGAVFAGTFMLRKIER